MTMTESERQVLKQELRDRIDHLSDEKLALLIKQTKEITKADIIKDIEKCSKNLR